MRNEVSTQKICGLLVYLGRLSTFQKYSLYTISQSLDHVFVATDDPSFVSNGNIQKISVDREIISNTIFRKLSIKTLLSSPYKLCDFKPFWPLLFSEYVVEFSRVAIFDVDCLWGNIRSFLPSCEDGEKPVIVGNRGHFMLFPVQFALKMPILFDEFFRSERWRPLLEIKKNVALDEFRWMHRLFNHLEQEEIISWDVRISRSAADISYWRPDFLCVNRNQPVRYIRIDCSTNSSRLRIFKDLSEGAAGEEVSYVHFQKRKVFPFSVSSDGLYFWPDYQGRVLVSTSLNQSAPCSILQRCSWSVAMFATRVRSKLVYESL